ncbi:MAG: hypothetical protein WCA56_09130 [Xanthobacteraceae bacterium]|jgi:plasmid stabilization system protein ParE
MPVVISDKSRSDLLRIYRHLEERSPNAANAFLRRIDKNFEIDGRMDVDEEFYR